MGGSLPSSFDATTQWAGLVHPIRNQEQCGSCWAFSASEVLSDRFAIATGKASPVLSPEDMVSCDTGDNGCHGGRMASAWDYLKNTGIVTDTCFPYEAGSGNAPSCPNQCEDSENWDQSKFKASSAYAINGVTNMQKESLTNSCPKVATLLRLSVGAQTTVLTIGRWPTVGVPRGARMVISVLFAARTGAEWKPRAHHMRVCQQLVEV